jgi:hypothetical protein
MSSKRSATALISLIALVVSATASVADDPDPTFNGLFPALECVPHGLDSACNGDYCIAYPTNPKGESFVVSLKRKVMWAVDTQNLDSFGFEMTDDPERVRLGYAFPMPAGSRVPIKIKYTSPPALNADLAVEFEGGDDGFVKGTFIFATGAPNAYNIFFSIKKSDPSTFQSGSANLQFDHQIINGTCKRLDKPVNWK